MKESFPQPCHTDRTADRAAPRPGELLTLLVTQAFLRLAQVRRGRQQTRPGAPGPRLLGGRVHDELRARRADELHILGAHVAHDAPEVAALVGPEHRDGGAGLACAASAAGAVQERLRVLGQVVVHHLRARATLHRVGIHLELHYALREARRAQRGARGGRRRPPTVRHRSMDTLASVADQRACRRRARPAFDSPHSVTPDIMEQATNGRSILDGTPACRPDKTTAGARRRTRSTSEMSRPRAATSVATSATNLPSRKCRSTVSRCFCEMSPCSACRPARRRISAGSSRRFNKRVGVRNVAVHRASRRAQPHSARSPVSVTDVAAHRPHHKQNSALGLTAAKSLCAHLPPLRAISLQDNQWTAARCHRQVKRVGAAAGRAPHTGACWPARRRPRPPRAWSP